MKKLSLVLFIFFLSFGFYNTIKAQCEPDMVTCVDTGMPGQICPLNLPYGIINEPYSQVVTIIPPYEADLGTGIIEIVKIKIESIANLPPGLSFEANAEEFYADSAYCVLLDGTPTEQGTFQLEIYVIPFIDYNGTALEMPAQVDDTSLTISIVPLNSEEIGTKNKDFSISPNPFYSSVHIAFNSHSIEQTEFSIFDLQGKIIFKDFINTVNGYNEFDYAGDWLNNGIYLISLKNSHQHFQQKLFKID